MKEKIRKNKFIFYIYKFIKNRIESLDFYRDRRFFLKNFIYSKKTIRKSEYNIMLSIHQIEKGMTSDNIRPFGESKVESIIDILKNTPVLLDENNYVYNYAMSILAIYKNIYEENGWTDCKEYVLVNDFISGKDYNRINAGVTNIKLEKINDSIDIDYYKFLSSRHSVRKFSDRILSEDDIKKAVNMALLSPSACNRQMCKIYYANSVETNEYMKKVSQGLSLFDKSNINFLLVTFDVSANNFVGERNQGWFNAGLFSMNFVNALHSLGIGSCFVQFGNSFNDEKRIKATLKINDSERIAVIIAAGYYENESIIPCSTRKKVEDVFVIR